MSKTNLRAADPSMYICHHLSFEPKHLKIVKQIADDVFVFDVVYSVMGLLIYSQIDFSNRLLRYVLIFEYQILVLDLVVDIRTKVSEGI